MAAAKLTSKNASLPINKSRFAVMLYANACLLELSAHLVARFVGLVPLSIPNLPSLMRIDATFMLMQHPLLMQLNKCINLHIYALYLQKPVNSNIHDMCL
jgi:hypothetical protein